MEPLACAIAATAATYVFASFTFAFAFVRRQADGDYGLLALMCVALAEYAFGGLLGFSGGDDAWLQGAQIGWMGLVASFAMLVHFALRYMSIRHPLRFLVPTYAVAFAFEWLDARGLLHAAPGAANAYAAARGIDIVQHSVSMTRLGVSAYGLGAAATAVSLILFLRAYFGGRREALALVLGGGVLLVTTLNDTAAAMGILSTGTLVNAGFVAFVLAASTTLSTRYAAAAADLEERNGDVRARVRELRRVYADLEDARHELSQKEQLAVVGELAAVIAHEVRNPLAIIANAVASLRKQATSREDRETLLSILDEETNRLNRLVRDLLRYARPVSLQRTQFTLHDLIERALGFLRTREGFSVDLLLECSDASAESKVWGDANLLRQVFDNLIDNAIQAMGTGGTLTVRVRSMLHDGASGLAVDIIDTGEGMDTQVRSRARDPFFTTRPSGTGLGLAIVDRIVEAHGGWFLIESSSGEGTTATVFLPYVPAREETVELSTG